MFKVIITILAAGVMMAGCTPFLSDKSVETTFQDRQVITVLADSQPLEVEVVTTVASTAQGLSGRDEIGHDGMLFVFSETRQRNFWMKEMKFAIDIVWIHKGVVVGVAENVLPPEENMAPSELPLYSSKQPVDMVLELPSGEAATRNISIGSSIKFQ